MLIPDHIHPESTVYFNGAMVLKAIKARGRQPILELYLTAEREHSMSLPMFVLSLDWLYLLNLVRLDEKGEVQPCS